MGTTALAEAEHLARIIKTYGAGGSSVSKEVVTELERTDDVAGASALSEFLRNWERNHPHA